ncbi:MAG: TrmH family RNA methyltransferase [Oscillospiraceae bacterium]
MVNIVLVKLDTPDNPRAIARTFPKTGARLHLIKPLGFDISDKAVKRCGLDYWYLVGIPVYENIDEYFAKNGNSRLYLATTKAPWAYSEADLSGDVTLMFGKEHGGYS